MRLGWTLLLPLAVLNAVITATVVAFGWPWWVNGLAGLAVIVAILLYERRKNILAQTVIPEEKMALPSSVRLAKFEKIATEQVPTVLEAKV
jgi:NADH-quinone oxidoreductase subunit H